MSPPPILPIFCHGPWSQEVPNIQRHFWHLLLSCHMYFITCTTSAIICTITSASFLLAQPWCELPSSLTEIIMSAFQLSFLSSASNRSNSSFKIGPDSFSNAIPNHITFLFKPFSGSIHIHGIKNTLMLIQMSNYSPRNRRSLRSQRLKS